MINRGRDNEGSGELIGFDPCTVGLYQQQQPSGACKNNDRDCPSGLQDDGYLSGWVKSALLGGGVVLQRWRTVVMGLGNGAAARGVARSAVSCAILVTCAQSCPANKTPTL